MEIGRRIYYEKSTGNVLVETGERSGFVVETSVEEDFATYVSLSERVPSAIGCIQLKYGQFSEEFIHFQLRIDTETENLIWTPRSDGTLDDAKIKKLKQLAQMRDTQISTSFQSLALGTLHTYNFSSSAQSDFRGKGLLLSLNPSISSVMWATLENGFVQHSREQFIQVITDGGAHEETLKFKYFQLENQVNSSTTIESVNAITW